MWSSKTDQTERMPRLIWVFAGRTGHFVGFVMLWLIVKSKLSHRSLFIHVQISDCEFSINTRQFYIDALNCSIHTLLLYQSRNSCPFCLKQTQTA